MWSNAGRVLLLVIGQTGIILATEFPVAGTNLCQQNAQTKMPLCQESHCLSLTPCHGRCTSAEPESTANRMTRPQMRRNVSRGGDNVARESITSRGQVCLELNDLLLAPRNLYPGSLWATQWNVMSPKTEYISAGRHYSLQSSDISPTRHSAADTTVLVPKLHSGLSRPGYSQPNRQRGREKQNLSISPLSQKPLICNVTHEHDDIAPKTSMEIRDTDSSWIHQWAAQYVALTTFVAVILT
jgi:hypothetical protein